MSRMGKKQELRRQFSLLSTIAFTCTVTAPWEFSLITAETGLLAGGPAGLFWSLVWSYIGQTFVVLSMAEMASMAPTAGGQYHWVSELAPLKHQKWMSYFTGWLATLTWQTGVALCSYVVGDLAQGVIWLASPDYVPERWHSTLLIIASIFCCAMCNIFGLKQLHTAEPLFAALHFIAFIIFVTVVLALAPKHSAHYVFLELSDNGAGWPSIGPAVLVGQLSAIGTIIASDCVAHLSEEISDAAVNVPKAMVASFLLNIPLTFGVLLTFLFCVGDIQEAIAYQGGYPFVYVIHNAVKSNGGTLAITVVLLVLMFFVAVTGLASTSRQLWAFSRDRGFPCSTWLSKVNPRMQIPTNSVIWACGWGVLLSFINIGSTVAFNAVLSVGSAAMIATYFMSIGCVTWRRFSGQKLPPSPWSLGRWGLPINCIACLYGFWSFFWCFWPTFYHVEASNFNWAPVLWLVVMIFCASYYWGWARKVYEGPVAQVKWQ
ncbi:putative amino acid transporter [Saccharata proteae CBS 121410]|uniref:Amino acid transporter n=1 Tax=Saccharata proteae CBS 121410 TaxID=1314787 RepID=A0A9P4LU44_9PEZI|nr:putative amino acid transporter [Saccharata proteae CBS 121410]